MSQALIQLWIPALPVAMPRPKACVRGGRGSVYTDSKSPVHAYQATVRYAVRDAYRAAPLTGPLEVLATFVFPRPTNKRWKAKPMPRLPHVTKPDVDNLLKSTFDCLNGLLWDDDKQIVSCHVAKFIACGDEQPHVELIVKER